MPSSLFRSAILALALALAARAADTELSAENLQRCKAATAMVELGEAGSGSSFLIDACGLFATNRHVAEGLPRGAQLKLILNSGEAGQYKVSARVVAISPDDDLALLKTDEPIKAKPLVLADGASLAELARVFVFGYPFGRMLASGSDSSPSISINAGRISSLRRDEGKLERIQLDAATNHGNSGGPLVGADGRVIGVIVSGIQGAK